MDHRVIVLVSVALLLLLAFNAVRRSKTWFGVFTGSEPLYFTDLPNLFPNGRPVEIREAPDAKNFSELEVAKQLLAEGVSVIYYRSQHPEGSIETMDVLARGKRGRMFRYEKETCVGSAGVGVELREWFGQRTAYNRQWLGQRGLLVGRRGW